MIHAQVAAVKSRGEGIFLKVFQENTSMASSIPTERQLLSPVRLCNPMDCSPPGLSVHGILQARILEWGAILFSRESSPPGIKPLSPALQADFLPFELPGRPYSTLYAEKRGVMCFKSSETCVQSRGWPSDKLAQV